MKPETGSKLQQREISNQTASVLRLRRLAYWLDEGIRIPGTKVRIGLDPIFGLLPGIGDAAGAILSGAILLEALRRGISRFGLLRMGANVAIDTVIGSVPIIGDLFDAGWKTNQKNLAILERHLAEPALSKRADSLFVLLIGGGLVVLCAAVIVVALTVSAKALTWLLTQS